MTEKEKGIYASQSYDLAEDWYALNEKYTDLEPISFNEFKELFLKTFRYFCETVNTDTIFRHDALLIKEMSIFYAFEDYPKGMSQLESEVCRSLIDGLIYSVARNAVILERVGIITVEISRRIFDKMSIELNDFENSLKKVMDACEETYQIYEDEEQIMNCFRAVLFMYKFLYI